MEEKVFMRELCYIIIIFIEKIFQSLKLLLPAGSNKKDWRVEKEKNFLKKLFPIYAPFLEMESNHSKAEE